jgi:hypothetical protein
VAKATCDNCALTKREKDFLDERARHTTIKETAVALGITESAAKHITAKIREKLGAEGLLQEIQDSLAKLPDSRRGRITIRGVEIPPWVPPALHERYVQIGRVDGEEAAAPYARRAKRSMLGTAQ